MTKAEIVEKPGAGEVIALRAEMFSETPEPGQPARLLGSECPACGERFFPRRKYCAACTGGGLRDVILGPGGKVETYTIVRQQLPGSAMVPPYAIVNVRLGKGPTVQTVVREGYESLTIGQAVGLMVEPVLEEDGRTYVSFVARVEPNQQAGLREGK